jgi:PAS domain S-box-containing protein
MGDPEKRVERLRLLARLNRLISSSLDYDEALTTIARAACEIMAVPSVSVWVADEDTRTVIVRAFSDDRVARGFDPAPIPFGQHGVGWVALHRRPLHVPDIDAPDSPVGQREWFQARGLRSAYAVPILFQDQMLGVLSLTRATPFDFDDDDRELLDGLVAQAAVAIHNARQFEASEMRRGTAEALSDLLRLLSQTLEVETVAQRIADHVRDLLQVGTACVYHLEPETEDLVVIATSVSPDSGFDWVLVLPRGFGTSGIAVQQKAPVNAPDVLADPRILYSPGARAQLERSPYRAVLAVPLLVQNRPIGAIAVADRVGRVFDADAVRLVQVFADQAAVALEHARLYDEAEHRRRQAEDAEERLRGLFERVPVGIYRSTPEGRILDANPALVTMLGYPDRETLLAVNAADHYARPEDRDRWRAMIEREGMVRDMDVEMRRHDGSVIWARESARAVSGPGGRVLHYEGTLEDVTERQRAEIAQRQAEALRSVTHLANAAAHEINNPLLVITGNLELLARRLPADDLNHDSIRRTLEACRRISDMVQHMGRITRLEVRDEWPGLSAILDLKKSAEGERG